MERAPRPDLTHEGVPARDGESTGPADVADDLQVARPELFLRLLVSGGDVAGRMDSDRSGALPGALECLAEQLGERCETRRRSSDDREHQREAVARGAHDRLRAAPDADP